MTLDLTKPMQTRDGRQVTLLTTEGRGKHKFLGYIGDAEEPRSWSHDGATRQRGFNEQPGSLSSDDLINVPEKPRYFVHRDGFNCGALYIEFLGDEGELVYTDQRERAERWGLKDVERYVIAGIWLEITQADAEQLKAEARKPKVKRWYVESVEKPIVFEIAGEWGAEVRARTWFQRDIESLDYTFGTFSDPSCRPLRRVEPVEDK